MNERDETCIETLRRLGTTECISAHGPDDIKIALMMFRSEQRDPDSLVHDDEYFAVDTRIELFTLGENLDDKFRINLSGSNHDAKEIH